MLFLLISLFSLDTFWLLIVTKAVVFGVIFLSITVITGMAGQISLCQATFAAVGGFATAQLVHAWSLPVLLTMLIGAVLAAAVGALLAIPALRLGGIFLALATFAFALMFDSIFVPLGWVSGGTIPVDVPRPELFTGDHAFFLLSVAVLAVAGVLVMLVRRGTTGRFLDALRGSETAAGSIGINPARSRVLAFALSAGIAGLGGGLLAMLDTQANYAANYSPFFGLVWLVLVVTISARTVEGAVVAGFALALFPELLKQIGISLEWQYVLFGLGALDLRAAPRGNPRGAEAPGHRGHPAPHRSPPPVGRRHREPAAGPGRPGRARGRGDDEARDTMTLLDARGISKRFAGINALDDVSLDVEAGEAVGLIGPNGAGKTTFFNCLLGMLNPDRGSVTFDGTDISRYPLYRRARLGLGRTFQRIELFGGMTVQDHLIVAGRSRLGTGRLWKDCLNLARPDRGRDGRDGDHAGAARADGRRRTSPSSR